MPEGLVRWRTFRVIAKGLPVRWNGATHLDYSCMLPWEQQELQEFIASGGKPEEVLVIPGSWQNLMYQHKPEVQA